MFYVPFEVSAEDTVSRRTADVPNGNAHVRSFVIQNQSRAAPRRSHLSHTTAFVGIEKSWTAFVVTDSTVNSPTATGVSLVPDAHVFASPREAHHVP